MNPKPSFWARCCKKKHLKVLSSTEREEIAKQRWRKVWLLRNILITVEEAKNRANDYGKSLYQGVSIEAGDENSKPKKWIVYPWAYWKKIWDLCIGAIKIYYCFMIPYYLGFGGNYEGNVIGLDFAFDILLFFDIIIRLSTAFVKDARVVDDRRSIVIRSVRQGLWIDIICVLPLYAANNNLMWFRILRLLQIGQMRTALENANVINSILAFLSFNDYNSKQAFLRVTNFMILFCIVVHNITCYLYRLAKDEDIPIETTYLGNNQLNNDQIYVKTLYYVITTISTVGYGDISPKTSKEIAFVMFVQFLGVVIFAYLTGNITSILMNLNQREKMISEREINLDKWFLDLSSHHKFRIPIDLQKSIKDYFLYYWENDHSSLLTDTGFLMRMPLALRNEFMDYLFSDEIRYFNVFLQDYDQQLKYSLMLEMYPRIFEEKTPVIKSGAEIDEIFIIRRGKVVLTTVGGVSFLVLGEKSFFGEEYTLFNKRSKVVYLADNCGVECFCIKKNKYVEILNRAPKSFQAILRRSFKRGKYFKAVMNSVVSKDTGTNEELKVMKTKSINMRSADDYLANFTWEFDEDEINELNERIMKNNEITVKEKIMENIKTNQGNLSNLQQNVEKITQKVDELKKSYETDVGNLVHVIQLLKDDHKIEANDMLNKLKLNFK